MSPVLTPNDLLELFRLMVLTRAAEERVELLHGEGHVAGSVFRSLGQEAGAVGGAYALRRLTDGTGDLVAPSLRGAGALFTFGATLDEYFRHYLGRASGPSGGRESHLHWGDLQRGLVGGIFPLGTLLEVMAGVTLAQQMQGEDRVGMIFAGDGATSTGAWHEGLAFAAAQRCPLILMVEHNRFAFSTPTDKNTRLQSFTEKAPGYGIGAEAVDGTDAVAVHEVTRQAAERARKGKGPQLVELRYFRRKGHAQHDAQDYVDPEILAEWEEKDPVHRLREHLVDAGHASPESLDALVQEAEAACLTAADAALAEPAPEGAEACATVYTDVTIAQPWTRQDTATP